MIEHDCFMLDGNVIPIYATSSKSKLLTDGSLEDICTNSWNKNASCYYVYT